MRQQLPPPAPRSIDTTCPGLILQPWVPYNQSVTKTSADIVGAKPEEVIIMNTLTVNVHLLMVPFYRPTAERFKVILEGKAFPSDYVRVSICLPACFATWQAPTSMHRSAPTCSKPSPLKSNSMAMTQLRLWLKSFHVKASTLYALKTLCLPSKNMGTAWRWSSSLASNTTLAKCLT